MISFHFKSNACLSRERTKNHFLIRHQQASIRVYDFMISSRNYTQQKRQLPSTIILYSFLALTEQNDEAYRRENRISYTISYDIVAYHWQSNKYTIWQFTHMHTLTKWLLVLGSFRRDVLNRESIDEQNNSSWIDSVIDSNTTFICTEPHFRNQQLRIVSIEQWTFLSNCVSVRYEI